jgi:DNA (cytosine-5)-methyltransferase 1
LSKQFNVIDLFSGAGGMSCGFSRHPAFRVIGAADAQNGKPSSGKGTLECNKTYLRNIGIRPMATDIGRLQEAEFRNYLLSTSGTDHVDVLLSCAPCTGFSRTIRKNLVTDDPRNSLVVRSAKFVQWFRPSVFLMENVGELLNGKSNFHFVQLDMQLRKLGYSVTAGVHDLSQFGLPQRRTRALVVACKRELNIHDLDELWAGVKVDRAAITVRKAISGLSPLPAGRVDPDDACHTSPNFSQKSLERLKRLPSDGGSWPDLVEQPGGWDYLIPSMKRYAREGKVGPYRDVYGRLAWDEPAVTIKRECAHTGNGRYAHPEQHRLCTVRELAILQGFPKDYQFVADSLSNMYRHIGDAVPPLISFQIAHLTHWILSGRKPRIEDTILANTHLLAEDILSNSEQPKQFAMSL